MDVRCNIAGESACIFRLFKQYKLQYSPGLMTSDASLEMTQGNGIYHIIVHYSKDDIGKLMFLNCQHEESVLNYLYQITPNPVVGATELIEQNIAG